MKNSNTVKAENQLRGQENIFYLGENGLKILIVGNSITWHAKAEELGWMCDCGMAASSLENDYVHLLFKHIKNVGIKSHFMVAQIAEYERNFWKEDILQQFIKLADFEADIVIFRIGENISAQNCIENNFVKGYLKLVDFLSKKKNVKYIFTTCFWENQAVDEVIRNTATKFGTKALELGGLGSDPSMTAKGLFNHSGVAMHPGDSGMAKIAELIFAEFLEKIK